MLESRDFPAAIQLAEESRSMLGPIEALSPPVEGVVQTKNDVQLVLDSALSFQNARATFEAALSRVASTGSDVISYDASLLADEQALEAISGAPREQFAKEIRNATKAVQKKRVSIRGQVKKAQRAQAEALALSAVCGDSPPAISGWDGELIGAESYIAQGAHDPDSIDVENCTRPVLSKDNCWVTACSVRGKNAFGALVHNRMAFSVGRNGILSAENL
jgi:hypothetical protein